MITWRSHLLPLLVLLLWRQAGAGRRRGEGRTTTAGVFSKVGNETSATASTEAAAAGDAAAASLRKSKFFPIFQIFTFPNDVCAGSSSRNGTCYTAAECASRGGSSSGSCAASFGVCCVFVLGCGGMSSENCTYIVQGSTSSVSPDPCTYTICPCNSNVCRIRFDFNTFNLAGPQTGQVSDAGTTVTTNGGSIGDCATDAFSLTAPGNIGSPVICGFNSGQHMIVDASSSCHVANFDIGATSDSRSWDIKVTQFTCGDLLGGPDGCLQYFTGTTGRISSFNFPTSSTTIGSTVTHLSSQCYTMCVRRETNFCAICYTTAITSNTGATNAPDTEAAQSSFGLSISSSNDMATQLDDTSCTLDYLLIPNGEAAPVTIGTFPATGMNRFCGRTFSTIVNTIIAGASVCSQQLPFMITFKTDANEAVGTNNAANMATTQEQSVAPGGIIGFSLNYVQQAC